jgi:hypothetical protein
MRTREDGASLLASQFHFRKDFTCETGRFIETYGHYEKDIYSYCIVGFGVVHAADGLQPVFRLEHCAGQYQRTDAAASKHQQVGRCSESFGGVDFTPGKLVFCPALFGFSPRASIGLAQSGAAAFPLASHRLDSSRAVLNWRL